MLDMWSQLDFSLSLGSYLLQAGAQEGADILSSSIELSRETAESWNQAWVELFQDGESGLWIGVVRLGTILGALSILYLAVKDGSQIIEKGSWLELARLFVWPLVIVFFLANNAALLAGTIGITRAIASEQVSSVLDYQLGNLTFRDAMSRQGISEAAEAQLINLYSDCMGLPPEEQLECRAERAEEAEAILDAAEQQANIELAPLRAAVGLFRTVNPALDLGLTAAELPTLIENDLLRLVRTILYALQWMVVNLLEAALLLTALFAPVAMGLSLLPFQGRMIFAWLVGFISLFGVQFGYNLVVGLVANRIGETSVSTINDIGFALLLAIGAPVLAGIIAKGGGVAAYSGLQGTVSRINAAAVGIAAFGARSLIPVRTSGGGGDSGRNNQENNNRKNDSRTPTTG